MAEVTGRRASSIVDIIDFIDGAMLCGCFVCRIEEVVAVEVQGTVSGLRGSKPEKRASGVLNASVFEPQYPSLLLWNIVSECRDVGVATD